MDHIILLRPWWEGYTPIPERSAGREKTLNVASVKSAIVLDLTTPIREDMLDKGANL